MWCDALRGHARTRVLARASPRGDGHQPPESETVAFARTQLHFHPDPIQAQVLDPNIRRGILNCCRQWGKSTTLSRVELVHGSPGRLDLIRKDDRKLSRSNLQNGHAVFVSGADG